MPLLFWFWVWGGVEQCVRNSKEEYHTMAEQRLHGGEQGGRK